MESNVTVIRLWQDPKDIDSKYGADERLGKGKSSRRKSGSSRNTNLNKKKRGEKPPMTIAVQRPTVDYYSQ